MEHERPAKEGHGRLDREGHRQVGGQEEHSRVSRRLEGIFRPPMITSEMNRSTSNDVVFNDLKTKHVMMLLFVATHFFILVL